MSPLCKHGIDSRDCAYCRGIREQEPLPPHPLRFTREGRPVLLLRASANAAHIPVLQLVDATPFVSIPRAELIEESPTARASTTHESALENFLTLAMRKGFLFLPIGPLTHRELSEGQPARCYKCRQLLSFKGGYLGCLGCSSYVCNCARCLCGFQGFGYQGRYISIPGPPPVQREYRLEYLRVVRFCSQDTTCRA